MALRNKYNLENLVSTDDFYENVNLRTVGTASVIRRTVSKKYEYIGMTRKAAQLCVKAKQCQYFRTTTTVDDNGNLVTSPADVLASIVPSHIAGDDWKVDVQLNMLDDVIASGSPININEAIRYLRVQSYDQPVTPFGGQLYIPDAYYGIDATLPTVGYKGFCVLPDNYIHSCFTPEMASTYEPVIQFKKDPISTNDWGIYGTRDTSWEGDGIRFNNLPSANNGDFVYLRLFLRDKVLTSRGWYSNVICQHWIPQNATIVEGR